VLLFAVLIGSVVLRAIFGRTLGSAFTGVGAGFLVYLGGYALALAGLAHGAFLITLLMGAAGAARLVVERHRGGLGGAAGRDRRGPRRRRLWRGRGWLWRRWRRLWRRGASGGW
jgi:hypothetical protein